MDFLRNGEHFGTGVDYHGTSGSVGSPNEKRIPTIREHFEKIALSLMADISMGFDPTVLPALIQSVYPRLFEGMFPGSFQHFLAIIIGSDNEVRKYQVTMQSWLRDHSLDQVHHNRTGLNMMDDSLFGSDVEILRKLVAPLRGDNSEPVFWVNTRIAQAPKTCLELQYAKGLLEEFHGYLVKSPIAIDTDPLIRLKTVRTSTYNESYQSLRQIRMDSAAATMQWDNINTLEVENSSFYQYYKRHVCRTSPGRAFQLGLLPPDKPSFPKEILEGLADSLPSWSGNESQKIVLDVIMKIAIWLTLARGFAALHLFCDTIRCFTFVKPGRSITYSRAFFLEHLVTLRPSDAIRVPSTVMREINSSVDDLDEFDRNPAYFEDVAKSHCRFLNDLYKVSSLIRKPHMPDSLANSRVPLGNVNSNITVSNRMPREWGYSSGPSGAMTRQLETGSDEMSINTFTDSAMLRASYLAPISSLSSSVGAFDSGHLGPSIDASDSVFFTPSISSSIDASHMSGVGNMATVHAEPRDATPEMIEGIFSDSNRSSDSTGDFESVYYEDAISYYVPTDDNDYVTVSPNDVDLESSNSSQAIISSIEPADGLLTLSELLRIGIRSSAFHSEPEYDTMDNESDDYDEH